MPKVVVQTIERFTIKAAAEAKTGRQRAASHSNGANKKVIGQMVANSSHRSKMASAHTRASAATAKIPSVSSLRDGRSRLEYASSISNGATVMIPSPSDTNQCCQVVSSEASV